MVHLNIPLFWCFFCVDFYDFHEALGVFFSRKSQHTVTVASLKKKQVGFPSSESRFPVVYFKGQAVSFRQGTPWKINGWNLQP